MMKLDRQQFGMSHVISGITPRNVNGMLPFAEARLQYCGSTKRNLANEKASECGSTIDQG